MELNRKPLYKQVAELLRKEIAETLSPGDQLEAEDKLAKRLAVSVITIREALWILAGEGTVVRQQGRGTFVGEATGGGRQVAVLMERDIAHPRLSYFFLRVTQQVRHYLELRGHRVQIYIGRLGPGEESETLTCSNFREDVEADKVSGVAAVYALPESSWTRSLEDRGIPLVGLGLRHRHMIDTDYSHMVEEGVRNLVENGRKKIACLGWNRGEADPGGAPAGGKPYERALERAFAKYDVRARPQWIRDDLHPAQAGAGWEEFREIWTANREKPDGLLVMDDFLFRDAAAAILDMNVRVPEDLKVVTHANKGAEILYPFPVTGLVVDPDLTALRMVEMLQTLLKGKTPENPRTFYPFSVEAIEPAGRADNADSRRAKSR